MIHSGQTDRTNLVILQPEIVRAFWSRRRAWNGVDMVLTVETRWVPDGTEIEVEIYEDDSAEGNADDYIETIEGPHVIENGRCVIEHRLEWGPEVLGAELDTEGSELEFYFLVKMERFGIEGRSNLLFVDLAGYEVGR
ncbi:MAG: hypothetical protein KC619_15420 [Myxococcales bacterium]|nr:hypothetical protein [Myxococcales bacterium]